MEAYDMCKVLKAISICLFVMVIDASAAPCKACDVSGPLPTCELDPRSPSTCIIEEGTCYFPSNCSSFFGDCSRDKLPFHLNSPTSVSSPSVYLAESLS